jgi:hypothetical protein
MFECLMIANALNSAESLAILVEMAALGILMNFLACEAIKRGYISEEIRDQGDVSNFDVAKRLYFIHCFA